MNIAITSELPRRQGRMTEAQRLARQALRTQIWRDANRGRVSPPVANRHLVDAFLLIISKLPPSDALPIMKAVSAAALDGMRRQGFPKDEARAAVMRRIELFTTEAKPSEVRQAARARRKGRPAERVYAVTDQTG